MEVEIFVIFFLSFCLLAQSSVKTDSSSCNFSRCDKRLPQDDDAELACCLIAGKRRCCKLRDIMPQVVGNISFPNEPGGQINKGAKYDATDTNGIKATLGIVIGIMILIVGCCIAFYYCCRVSRPANNEYIAPVITQHGGRRTVVSVPIGPRRHDSHVHITITNEGVSSIHYNPPSKPPDASFSDEPPKYDEVNTVSTPVGGTSDDTSDSLLPSYQAASNL